MKRLAILLFLCVIPFGSLVAHPHMLVFAQCELAFENGRATGFWVELEFDSFFSGEIIWAYDEDRSGSFDAGETGNLYENAFSNLKEYGYFIFIREGDKRYTPQKVESFSARCEGPESLFYRYFVPLDGEEKDDFYIAVYDYSYFCAVRYQDDYILLTGEEPGTLEISLEENKDYPVYYNPKGKATDKTLYGRWAPGLSTFIPTEIHVRL